MGLVACRLPEDVEQLERVNSAMSNLATDNDRDVAAEARAVNDLFKRTPVSLCPPACPMFSLDMRERGLCSSGVYCAFQHRPGACDDSRRLPGRFVWNIMVGMSNVSCVCTLHLYI